MYLNNQVGLIQYDYHKNVLEFLGFLFFYKHFPFYLSDSKEEL